MDEVSISYCGDFQATITIERPDTLNSLAASTLTELARAAAEVSARGDSLRWCCCGVGAARSHRDST